MDIEARCIVGKKMFKMCPARLDTALFHLQNDCDTYRAVEAEKNKRNKTAHVRAFLLNKMKLSRPDANKVIDMYWEEVEEEEKARIEAKNEDKLRFIALTKESAELADKIKELDTKKKELENVLVSGIICNLCSNELPPHTIERHLDPTDQIHCCPHL
jgi:hypothetical protein